MTAEPTLTSDIIGLTRTAPLSRRGFMTASAAIAAGYTLAAGPVRADPANPAWPKSPTQLAPDMKAPVLGLYGEADQGIPTAQVEAMKAALATANKPAEFKIYPGAPHGFHADYRPSYRKDAADDAWKPDAGLVQEIRGAGLISPSPR
jgi:dienelactone hydrolase